jgi:amidase
VAELEKQGTTVVTDPFGGTEFAAYLKAAGSVGSDSVIWDMQKYLVRTKLLQIINDVMDKYKLDAFVYPQMFKETPLLESQDNIGATTVSEINTAGVPLVTVPADSYQEAIRMN